MMMSPSGSPKSRINVTSACRAIAISFSTDPFCSSVGATSYQQKGARSLPSPHFSFQTASKRSRTWLAPSAAMNSTPLWRLITRPRNCCPVATAAAKSIAVNVLAVPHCPDNRPCPRAGSTCFTSHVASGRGSVLPCTKSCGRSDCSGSSSSRSASSSSGSSSNSGSSSSGSSGSSGGEGGGGVGLVENKAALIVGEPNDKLLLLLTSRANRFHGHSLDPKFLFGFQVFGTEVLRLIVVRRENH